MASRASDSQTLNHFSNMENPLALIIVLVLATAWLVLPIVLFIRLQKIEKLLTSIDLHLYHFQTRGMNQKPPE